MICEASKTFETFPTNFAHLWLSMLSHKNDVGPQQHNIIDVVAQGDIVTQY